MDNRNGLDSFIAAGLSISEANLSNVRLAQLKKIQCIFDYARQHSPFYQERFASSINRIASFKDFKSLPVLNSQDIVQDGTRMLCVSPEQAIRAFTSGTTSSPKRLLFTEPELEQTISFFRFGSTKFISAGEKALLLFPCQSPFGPGDLFCRALSQLEAIPIRFGVPHTPEEALQKILQIRPRLVLASPETALSLLEVPVSDSITVPILLISGSALSEKDQIRLRNALNCQIYLEYGLTETVFALGLSCADSPCYHLREDAFYTEILDEKNQPLPTGVQGRVVVTSLSCGAMPLIRYDTGDIASYRANHCRCSSLLPVLSLVEPRKVPKGYFASGPGLL